MDPQKPNRIQVALLWMAVIIGVFWLMQSFQPQPHSGSIQSCLVDYVAPPRPAASQSPYAMPQQPQPQVARCSLQEGELYTALESKNSRLKEIVFQGTSVFVLTKDGRIGEVYDAGDHSNLKKLVREAGIPWSSRPTPEAPWFISMLPSLLPVLLFFGLYIFLMKRMGGMGGGRMMGFGQSKAKLLTQDMNVKTFADVAGCDEAKGDMQEFVDFLRDPLKFTKLGGKLPKGALLVGPPGTGKTLLAAAVAGEAKVPFFTISGSDFVEMFVGVGASRVRDMFEQAKKCAPCMIFIDEIDAVGRHRGAGLGGGNDEREQTLNQLLVEMDGFQGTTGIVIFAATNRPDVLDPALLRPGRFDRQIVVPNPDLIGREAILKVHVKKVPLSDDIDLMTIARGTPGFSGADLANLVNEAALRAARTGKTKVGNEEFEHARDKILMGAERKSLSMLEEEKLLTAYHEGGHALCIIYEPAHDPLHKLTIVPRGRALGLAMFLPERDKTSMSYTQYMADLVTLYGGRIAEEMIFGKDRITSGASSDIQQATKTARAMVTQFGFSDDLGRVRYEESQEEVFLGHSVARNQSTSEDSARRIDEEIRRLCKEAEGRARSILETHRVELDAIAMGLMEVETLSADSVKDIARQAGGTFDKVHEDYKAAYAAATPKVRPLKEVLREAAIARGETPEDEPVIAAASAGAAESTGVTAADGADSAPVEPQAHVVDGTDQPK